MSTFVIPHKLERVWKPSSPEDWAVVSTTEDTLRQKIEVALNTDKQLRCSFEGFYHDSSRKPTYKYWKECNPDIAFGINRVCKELSSKGWKPFVTLSERYYSRSQNSWLGGTMVPW